MKTLSLNFAISLLSIFSYSQTELIENEWYLQKLVIDGQEISVPETSEFNNVSMSFYFEDLYFFSSEICSTIDGMMSYVTNSDFSFFDITCCGGGTMCTESENASFENLYTHFYVNYFEYNFSYNIEIKDDGSKKLTVFNQVGNYVIYTNQLMTVNDLDLTKIVIYPNPVGDILIIDNSTQLNLYGVSITNSTGKIIYQQELNSSKIKVDMSSFPAGIYFTSIKQDGVVIQTKKIIKK